MVLKSKEPTTPRCQTQWSLSVRMDKKSILAFHVPKTCLLRYDHARVELVPLSRYTLNQFWTFAYNINIILFSGFLCDIKVLYASITFSLFNSLVLELLVSFGFLIY
jgi:hypothetical protein